KAPTRKRTLKKTRHRSGVSSAFCCMTADLSFIVSAHRRAALIGPPPAEWSRWNVSLRLAVAPAWPPPRAFQPRPPLPIYPHIILARPRTLPTGFIAPCLPTKTDNVPSGGRWLHQIKHDRFRIIAAFPGH